MKSIYINGHTFHHGDHVTALLNVDYADNNSCNDFVELSTGTITVYGILYIKDNTTCYVCQDAKSGDNSYCKEFDKNYSWFVRIRDDGFIVSSDTYQILPRFKTEAKPAIDELEDDDPMPDDWEIPFTIPEHL